MLNDAEFKELEERLIKGKELLAKRGWNSEDPETREWIRIWQSLGDQHWYELQERGIITQGKPHTQLLQEAEERVLRVREAMIARGLIKPKKERRKRTTHDTTRVNSDSLFATS